jgi:hypothetical protein
LLSFFVDFWFYLPVIFQVAFFRVFHLSFFRDTRHRRVDYRANANLALGGP